MDPRYFLYELTLAEARDFIKGQDRRARQGWEQARMISSYMVASMGGEPDISLPWDDENEAPKHRETPEEQQKKWDALKKRAEQMTKYLKQNK